MISYDLIIHKAIIKRLKDNGIIVKDNSFYGDLPVVVLSDSVESSDNTKTFNRNEISYIINMWGSKNGSSLELKQLKAKVTEVLTEHGYDIEGYIIDDVKVDNVTTFKEYEEKDKTTHFYHGVLTIIYKIRRI